MFEDKKWEKEFTDRFSRHYDEMKWLYCELYNNDEHAFDYFCDMLHDYYAARSETLKEWDRGREVIPN